MIHIQLITTPGCTHCHEVKKIFEEVKGQFPDMQVEEIDATTPHGMELVSQYGIFSSPGVVINGDLFAMGGLKKDAFIKKLESLK